MGQKAVVVLEPDIIDDEVRTIKDSSGEECRVVIKKTLVKRGNIPKEIVINDKILGEIEGLSAFGLKLSTIADYLDIDFKILNSLYTAKTKVHKAVKTGKAKGIAKVNESFFKVASETPNVMAKMAWLSRQEDATEKTKVINPRLAWEQVDNLTISEAEEKYFESQRLIAETEERRAEIEEKNDGYNKIFEEQKIVLQKTVIKQKNDDNKKQP